MKYFYMPKRINKNKKTDNIKSTGKDIEHLEFP